MIKMSDRGLSSHEANSVYNELRLEGHLIDAVIKVKDVEFQIHKNFLCNCSPYFRILFTSWSAPDKNVFEIPGLSPEMMQLIIEFAYTGTVFMTEDNAQELLLAADQLNVTDLTQACCDFLREQLCPKNCIGIWQFTNICFLSRLQHEAFKYIVDNFEEVVISEEFQHLSVQELLDILKRDDLSVTKENTVFEAVLQWIAHASEIRKKHLVLLLSKVRLALASVDYINLNVMTNAQVNCNDQCLQMVEEALQIKHQMSRHNPPLSGVRNPVARPRLPNAILLAFGGWSGSDPTNGIEAYDVRTDLWINVTNNLEPACAYHGTAVLNGYVYCVGGFDRLEYFNSVRRFDLSTRTWHEAAPMYNRRCYVSVTLLDGCIYAMGGYNGQTRLNTAELYRPENNQWSLIAPMNEQRSDASCTTLHSKIYICGGFNGHDCLQTCEYYSPETNQWTMISSMNSPRSGIGVIAYEDQVYAVGGFDGNLRQRNAEAYNPGTNTWHAVPSMLTARSNFGIEVIHDQLFVVGGYNGLNTTSRVEYYDASVNAWTKACSMKISRSAVSCCVVSGLPNMAEYTAPRDSLPLLQLEDWLVSGDL